MASPRPADAQYTINGAQTNQVIDGFGVNINHRNWNNDELKPVLDTMIGQGGFTIFRIVFDNTDWAVTNNMTQASYNAIYGSARFAKLWDLVAYLNQKGITNGIMFNFQGTGAPWMGGSTLTAGYEPQWAQMISSLLVYARNTRHLQFHLVGPDNEPDNASQLVGVGCSQSQYLTMLKLLAQNLNSNGITDIKFVGPDLASTTSPNPWISTMLGSSQVMSNVAHFGAHSYQGGGTGSSGIASTIASSSYPNTTFWMTEFNNQCNSCYEGVYNTNNYSWTYCSDTAQYLIYHLGNGASAGLAWEGYDSYYELLPLTWVTSGQQVAGWSFYGLFGVDNTNAVSKTYTARKSFYTMSQISAFVPPGAQRLSMTGSQTMSFTMLAFYDPVSGRVTLTGFNTGSQTSEPITLQSLPAVSNFTLYYTDPSNNLKQSTTFPVASGSFTATIPGNCIFTLTGFDPAKIAVSVQLTNPATGTQYTAPATIPLAATASTTTGAITNVVFYNGATPLATNANAPYGFNWSNVGPGTYTVTASAADSAGHTAVSSNIVITVSGDPAQIMVWPANTNVIPWGQQQFGATVLDALGNPVFPQPPVGWSAGGGIINSSGWFLAGGTTGGPFPVLASNPNGLSGLVNITIASNINVAPYGIGYTWYNLATSTGNTPQYEAPGINDGVTNIGISLLAEYDGSSDLSSHYEAAGVVWPTPQTISNVVFINGSITNGDGTFDAALQLQFTQDGLNWTPAGPQWTVSPAYNYNASSGGPTPYVFSGSMATVLGARCVGQVATSQANSSFATATEVQAYMGAPPPLQASATTNGIVVWWPGPVTNCVLQSSTNLPPVWTTVTNARQLAPGQISVTINPPAQQQFFRLIYP